MLRVIAGPKRQELAIVFYAEIHVGLYTRLYSNTVQNYLEIIHTSGVGGYVKLGNIFHWEMEEGRRTVFCALEL